MKPEDLQKDMKRHFAKKAKSKSRVEIDPLSEIVKQVSKRVEGQKDTIKFITIMNAMAMHTGCKGTSGNVLLRSESGAGKDYILNEIRRPWGFDNYQRIQKLTKEGITYVDKKNNPEFTYDGKVLHLEEVTDRTINNKSMLAFMSNNHGEEFTMKSVKDNTAQNESVKGKPIIFMTSSTLDLDYDNLRRVKLWYLNVSNEQIKKAMKKENEIRRKAVKVNINQSVLDYLSELQQQAFDVDIPFSDELLDSWNNSFVGNIPMQAQTIWSFVLDFVGAITILHYKTRKKDSAGRLIAEPADLEIARPILDKLFRKGIIPVMPREQDIIDIMKHNNIEPCTQCLKVSCGHPHIYTNKELRDNLEVDVNYTQMERHLELLLKKGLITKQTGKRCGYNNRKIRAYSANTFAGFKSLALSIVKDVNETNDINEINEINEINQKTGQEPLVSLVSQVSLVSSLSSLSYIEQKHVDIIPEDFSDTTFDNVDIKQKYSALTMKNVNNLMEYYLAADMISEAGQGRFIFR